MENQRREREPCSIFIDLPTRVYEVLADEARAVFDLCRQQQGLIYNACRRCFRGESFNSPFNFTRRD